MEREELFTAACDALRAALPNAWAIYVYGSFARGEEWPDSDLDLAVLLPPGDRIPDLLALVGEIATRTNRDVDLVDLRTAGDTLRREVLADGRTLFISRPDHVLAWEASALSRYARHREEIRDLLDDFRRTGIGYGS
jgi:predicted nucleotidyltransferase